MIAARITGSVALLLAALSSTPAPAQEHAAPTSQDYDVSFLGLGELFGFGDDENGEGEGEEDDSETGGIEYTVEIKGVDEESFKDTLEKSAQLIALQEKPPATGAGLLRRIESDVERFKIVLRSEGYYAGDVQYKLDSQSTPAAITIAVNKGEPYILNSYTIRYVETEATSPSPRIPPLSELGIETGDLARGAGIVAAEGRIVKILKDEARPFAKRVDREVIVDHRSKTVTAEAIIDPGPRATFGTVDVEGLERTEEDYVRQWISWSLGDPYDEGQVDTLRSNLVKTGLFDSVAIEREDHLNTVGELHQTIRVQEGKPRSIGFGVGYATDRGAGGKVFWRHRNLFGRDEDFEVSLGGDTLEQEAVAEFVRPNFGRENRKLFARAQGKRSDTDAFQGLEASLTGGLEWPLSERWSATAGGSIEFSNLTDSTGRTSSLLFGIPAGLKYRGADDELNPTEGVNFDLLLTPYTGESDKSLLFNVTEGTLRGYYPIDSEKRYVLAGRLRLGSIVGEETFDIPANKRLYAGGGGSIRGYAYQQVGPLDDANDPIGGRS
ncbi:MAG: BamA/TamA family outer membrane protein, partial [Rhodospirillales bacterium]|nr:BamA/TamA family outer membrane protein [Rhodospirillales bacterium]